MSVSRQDATPMRLSFERPKGEQLQEILEDLIATLQPGELLPSERALAEQYGVARMTVRGEIDRLVAKGLAYRVQGRGTFVGTPKLTQSANLTSFSEDMRARGMNPGSKLLNVEVAEATDLVAGRLGIEPGQAVVRIERVRTADDEPMALERAYLPAERFEGLEKVDLTDRSLYEELAARWGVRLDHAQQRISVVMLDSDEAELLAADAGQPAFLFQRTTFEAADYVVEYVRSLYRGDRYEVESHLER